MNKKIIIDLCGGTGAWSKPYKKNGYDVKIITLPDHDLFEYEEYKNFIGDVYGILAAPTCKVFSFARTTKKTTKDEIENGLLLVNRCLEIIMDCNINGNLKFWALENPLGRLRKYLGKPVLTFNPNEYGDNYTKRTDIWGYFNIPDRFIRHLSDEEKARMKTNSRTLPKLPKDYILPSNMTKQAARRAMTSRFFAEAFFKANR